MSLRKPDFQELATAFTLLLLMAALATISNVNGTARVVGRRFFSVLIPGDVVDIAATSMMFIIFSGLLGLIGLVFYLSRRLSSALHSSAGKISLVGMLILTFGVSVYWSRGLDVTSNFVALIANYITYGAVIIWGASIPQRSGLMTTLFVGMVVISVILVNQQTGRASALQSLKGEQNRAHIVTTDRIYVNAALITLYRHGALIKSGSDIIYYPSDKIVRISKAYDPSRRCDWLLKMLEACD